MVSAEESHSEMLTLMEKLYLLAAIKVLMKLSLVLRKQDKATKLMHVFCDLTIYLAESKDSLFGKISAFTEEIYCFS